MKATYNKAVMAARGILQQAASKNGVSYEEVYEGFQNSIRYALVSIEPETVQFWNDVKRHANKEVPSPEDVLVYISEMSKRIPETRHRNQRQLKRVFH